MAIFFFSISDNFVSKFNERWGAKNKKISTQLQQCHLLGAIYSNGYNFVVMVNPSFFADFTSPIVNSKYENKIIGYPALMDFTFIMGMNGR